VRIFHRHGYFWCQDNKKCEEIPWTALKLICRRRFHGSAIASVTRFFCGVNGMHCVVRMGWRLRISIPVEKRRLEIIVSQRLFEHFGGNLVGPYVICAVFDLLPQSGDFVFTDVGQVPQGF